MDTATFVIAPINFDGLLRMIDERQFGFASRRRRRSGNGHDRRKRGFVGIVDDARQLIDGRLVRESSAGGGEFEMTSRGVDAKAGRRNRIVGNRPTEPLTQRPSQLPANVDAQRWRDSANATAQAGQERAAAQALKVLAERK